MAKKGLLYFKMVKIRPLLFLIILGGTLALLRFIYPERGLDILGFRAIIDAIFALGLLCQVWVTAIGVGRRIMRITCIGNNLTKIEKFIFFSALGLGVISLGLMFLGLMGILRVQFIILWLLSCALTWGGDEIRLDFPHLPASRAKQGVLLIAGITLILTITHALTPPWDYDSLMYHLEGPRRFLESGRIIFIPDIWQANGPFLIEMLFGIGLAFQSDTFPKLIHLAFGILLGLSTFSFANRYLGQKHGWIALAILLGTVILPIWASWAYADFAWALYEFLALYSITLWLSHIDNRQFLTLAGLFSGMAMGTKYLAMAGTALITIWVIWESRNFPVKRIISSSLRFLAPAILISAPWWIKNAILTGNPIYPFVFTSSNWDSNRIALLMSYLQSFGTGRTLWDYLLLPVNLYLFHASFSTFPYEILSFLFPISIIYIAQRNNRILNKIGLYAIAMFCVWAAGSQQTRFLLPIFPILTILSSSVLYSIPSVRFRRPIAIGLAGGLCLTAIILQGVYFFNVKPLSVVIGHETKNDFLRRNVFIYKAQEFINTKLPSSSKILMQWNGQTYYCRNCVPDADQMTWSIIAGNNPKIEEIIEELNRLGISHILFSKVDVAWFQEYHDPNKTMDSSLEFFFNKFVKDCGRSIYSDKASILYEITCH
jgi:hypothetical protein